MPTTGFATAALVTDPFVTRYLDDSSFKDRALRDNDYVYFSKITKKRRLGEPKFI